MRRKDRQTLIDLELALDRTQADLAACEVGLAHKDTKLFEQRKQIDALHLELQTTRGELRDLHKDLEEALTPKET